MKKIIPKLLLAIGILYSFNSKAQTIDTTSIEGLYQYIFNVLDKTQIPTHYLEEYGAPVLTMAKYNGVLTDSNVVDMNVWRTLYWEIASTYVGTATNSFTAITNVNAAIKPLVSDTLPIPVPLLFAKYNSVKSTAFSLNLLQVVNNQVKDVAGRPQSPYQQNNLFAAAPLRAYTNTGIASFIFKSNLFYTNGTATVSSISVDFADGSGYKPVTFNNAITINYIDTGIKQLKIKLVLSDATTSQCYSNFYVAKAVNQTLVYDKNSYDLLQPFFPTANHSGGNVYVRYSRKGTERTITKPLIVVEGYDIHSAAPDIEPYNYGYSDFVNAINIETPPFDFNGHLDDVAGYDLIFVDYNDGTDDITRNAALIEDVITWVNAQKAANGSAEQNVVMGISMGGLVARYALADMTKKSLSTGTRLLITHDSPHRGANVPLGLQHLIQMAGGLHLFSYNIRDVFPQYDEAINLLTRPASQQLLLYRATGATTSVANTFLNVAYRNMITFPTSGPQPTYSFVATSLGSECGHPLFPAYQQLINADADAFAFFFPLLSYHFHTTVKAYALPNTGSTSLIASLLLKSKFKLFGLITISKQVYNSSAYAPGTQLPVDGAPGGKYALNDGTIPQVKVFLPFGFLNILGYIYAYSGALPKAICFVPAGSALDVSPYNTTTFSQKFVAGNNAAFPSTSKNYIAQETLSGGVSNNDHPRFTARNAEWEYDQMENIANTLNCSTECSPDLVISISANPVCNSAIVSIPGLSTASTVTWTATPSGSVTITPNGQQATITKGSYNGNVTITALVNSCNSYSKTIYVGGPVVTNITYSMNGGCNGLYQTWSLAATANTTVSTWLWTVDNPANNNWYIYNPGSPTTFVDVTGGGGITISATNACGTGKNGVTIYSNCGHGAITASPNPATDNVTIAIADSKTAPPSNSKKAMIYQLKVIDENGNLKKQYNYSSGITNTTISMSGLISGAYTIQAFDGSTWNSVKVIKQ